MARIKGKNYLCVEHFKDLYKDKGYKQESLAEKIDVSVETLKNWMGRKTQRPIPMDKAERLASVLGVSVWEIIGSDGRTSFASQHQNELTVASDFVNKDEQLIVTLLSRHGRQPLFESDNEDLEQYRGEYLSVLLNSLLEAHDRFVEMADIAERQQRHEMILNDLDKG